MTKLLKERDHAIAKAKKLKREKVEFGDAHARLSEKLETRDISHKALKSEFSILNESHDQLQIRLSKYDVPSTSKSTYIHKENARVEDELVNDTTPKGNGVLICRKCIYNFLCSMLI